MQQVVFMIDGGWVRRWEWRRWMGLPYPRRCSEPLPISHGEKGALAIPSDTFFTSARAVPDILEKIQVDIWMEDGVKSKEYLFSVDSDEGQKDIRFYIHKGEIIYFAVPADSPVHQCEVTIVTEQECFQEGHLPVPPEIETLFPREKLHFWYCGEIYNYAYELQQHSKPYKTSEMGLPCERFLINPYSDAGGKVPREGDIIPCIKLEGWIGYYIVTRKGWYSHYGDFATWDDGKEVDLVLHHIEKADADAEHK